MSWKSVYDIEYKKVDLQIYVDNRIEYKRANQSENTEEQSCRRIGFLIFLLQSPYNN